MAIALCILGLLLAGYLALVAMFYRMIRRDFVPLRVMHRTGADHLEAVTAFGPLAVVIGQGNAAKRDGERGVRA
jgi:hypothetical protein